MSLKLLALTGALSLTALLAACGGGGSSYAGLPASWNGTWLASSATCEVAVDRAGIAGGGTYYANTLEMTFSRDSASLVEKRVLYNDALCLSKAGAITTTYNATEINPTTVPGYADGHAGTVYQTRVDTGNDGTGSGVFINSTSLGMNGDSSGLQGGLSASNTLCLFDRNADGTPNTNIRLCYTKQ